MTTRTCAACHRAAAAEAALGPARARDSRAKRPSTAAGALSASCAEVGASAGCHVGFMQLGEVGGSVGGEPDVNTGREQPAPDTCTARRVERIWISEGRGDKQQLPEVGSTAACPKRHRQHCVFGCASEVKRMEHERRHSCLESWIERLATATALDKRQSPACPYGSKQ
jgi:hypothetical protein